MLARRFFFTPKALGIIAQGKVLIAPAIITATLGYKKLAAVASGYVAYRLWRTCLDGTSPTKVSKGLSMRRDFLPLRIWSQLTFGTKRQSLQRRFALCDARIEPLRFG
jgi:hypothetical protein